jgi:hypothetical protein
MFWTATLTFAMTALVLAWALLPLPDLLGTLTVLNRVPGYRIPLAPGLGSVVVLAVVGTALGRGRLPWWLLAVIGAATAATAAAMVWATGSLPWQGGQPDATKVALVAAAMAVAFGIVLTGRFIAVGATLAALVAAAVFSDVSPLVRGLGPLDDDPVVTTLLPYGTAEVTPRAAVYDDRLNPLVTASGVENLSGLTAYPDPIVWNTLAPEQKGLWNNYAKYTWTLDLAVPVARIKQTRGTQMQLFVNPCSAPVRALDITLSLSTKPMAAPCLTLEKTIPWHGETVYLYRTVGA